MAKRRQGQEGLTPRFGDLHDRSAFARPIHSGWQPVFFETTLHLSHHRHDVKVPHDEENLDGLNYLEGRSLGNIQDRAFEGTLSRPRRSRKNNNVVLELEKMDAYHLGYLFYFFERACAMSAYLNEVNPFNQPGVEIYKKNMFQLARESLVTRKVAPHADA
jgi:glucose-6-phosphate isomerase